MPTDNEEQDAAILQRLGLSPGVPVWVGGHHQLAKNLARRLIRDAQLPATGPVEVAIVTPDSIDEAVYFATKIASRLHIGGKLWALIDRNDECAQTIDRFNETLSAQGLRMLGDVPVDENWVAVGGERTRAD